MSKEKFHSFLGLCQKAGQVVSGEVGVSANLKRRTLHLVILAQDTSENTKQMYLNEAKKHNVLSIILGDKASLGSAIGKEYRAVIGIKDKNMAQNLIRIYKDESK